MDADVAVIGVGTMGSMAVWHLVRKGVSVLGFEQFGIGHDRSAVGGGSRIFRTAYLEGHEYVPILKESYRQWRMLEKESNQELLTINGGLMIGDSNLGPMKALMESIDKYNLEHEVLNEEDAKERYPQHRLLTGEKMVLDKNAGFLRPELSVISAVNLAENLGAKVFSYTKVTNIAYDGTGVTITTNDNEYRVGKVIITTGPWVKNIVPEFNDVIKIRRLIMAWFAPKDVFQFEPENFPVFARRSRNEVITGAPVIDGNMVRISNNTTLANVDKPELFDKNIPIEDVLPIRNAVQDYFSGLHPDPVRVNAFMEGYTEDKHPIVGKMPGKDNTIILCGFSGHGFKMSPVMGEIAANFALDIESPFSVDFLSPTRYANA
ncbi:N-methyl-L-tryptophan oxidase [Virgibacillus dakarensis]|uniref:N-methyl-L-tryptophan oxidase n=1 Tax=Virgibacillus dakarensis TaxID=1917889 RepID=UPI000B439977|nr:N-methyl-L-tryptophan oxidase [Virgibacillus dakarensis]